MKRVIQLVLLGTFCLLLAACSSSAATDQGEQNTDDMTTSTPVTVITFDMNGQTVEVVKGDEFQVSIPTIPVEGFNWEPDKLDSTILEQVGQSIYQMSQGADSGGGNVILTFKAVGTGTTSLNLIYTQSRVNNPKAMFTKSFAVTLDVK